MSDFENGASSVRVFSMAEAPKPLLVAAPCGPGEYPVVMLQHGFALYNSFYSQLMHQIASHGFIVLAPQMYRLSGPDASQEISEAARIVEWISTSLFEKMAASCCPSARPNVHKFALIGHSRGGKVAFALALQFARAGAWPLKISALVALDPVDGTSNGKQTKPPVLKFRSNSLDVGCPVLIVGAGLGSQRKNLFVPACAPEQVGYKAFFEDCCPPAFLLRAPQHGHMDFLDDETKGTVGRLSYYVGKNGNDRKPMRTTAGGLAVAFLQYALSLQSSAFQDVLSNLQQAPGFLDEPEVKE